MNKKNVLTAVGIILSFVIAVGGWIMTSELIDMESDRLLSGTRSFLVNIPPIEAIYMDEEGDYPSIIFGLTDDEIVSILRNWELTDNRRPHEPAAGQIDMETAIISARTGVNFLFEYNILSDRLRAFDHTEAFLSQNIPRGGEFLPLRYSYWTVRFSNSDIEVLMTINAVTGQVWKIEVALKHGFVAMTPRLNPSLSPHWMSVNYDEITTILNAFMSDLGIRANQAPVILLQNNEPWLDPDSEALIRRERGWSTMLAYQRFANDNAAVIIDIVRVFPPPTVYDVLIIEDYVRSVQLVTDGVIFFNTISFFLTV